MAKLLNREVIVRVELNQDEVDCLVNLLDMFYQESNYKRWANKLQHLRSLLSTFTSQDEPPF